jgi:23S rRNA pseudouridine955/2504/2580 synthase/23S rRNA pseudouridine1911/1915/1917 synthase
MLSDNNKTRTTSTLVESADAGKRLDVYLSERFTYLSRTEWQTHVRNARILLNGGKSRSSRKLQSGECIEFLADDIEEPAVDKNHEIVHSDESLIVVSKSGNLPCHPAGPFFKNTLWYLLEEKFGKVYFINRIDRETSGLVLLARKPEIAGKMSEKHCEILKKYIVLVHGSFPAEYHARGYLMQDEKSAVRKKRRFAESANSTAGNSEYAETKFRLLETDSKISVVEAELVTGRLHQIRATLCSLGYPLVGDKIYGLDENIYIRFVRDGMTEADRLLLVLNRQALHAASLVIRHPVTGELWSYKTRLPEDMGKLLINFSKKHIDIL